MNLKMSCIPRSSDLLKVGKVLGLFVSKNPVEKIALDRHGVKGDKFYKKDVDRSVLISSQESYTMAEQKDIHLLHGQLGENIIIDYNPYALQFGDKIEIGEVFLQITQNCTLCKSLTKIDAKLPNLLKKDRGIFAKVIKGGTIYKNDDIYITSK